MSNPLSADLLTAVENWAVEYVIDVLKGVTEMMQADGRVVGDVDLNRQQRILAFEAMQRSGEINSLAVVNPQMVKDDARQYERDLIATPPYTGKV